MESGCPMPPEAPMTATAELAVRPVEKALAPRDRAEGEANLENMSAMGKDEARDEEAVESGEWVEWRLETDGERLCEWLAFSFLRLND